MSIVDLVKGLSLFIPISVVITSITFVFTITFKDNREHILLPAQVIGVISASIMIFLCSQALPQLFVNRTYIHFFAFLSIFCFMLHPTIGIWGWTNWIHGIGVTTFSCRLTYFTALGSYNLGKTFMYWVFALRIRDILSMFQRLQIPCLFWSYIALSFIVPTVVWSYWMYDVRSDVKPHGNGTSFHHCYPMRSVTANDNVLSIFQFVVDGIFSFGALLIYLWKWHQIYNYEERQQHLIDNPEKQTGFSKSDIQETMKPILKRLKNAEYCSVITLCSIAMISTFIFTSGIFWFKREIGFFLSADSLVNAWCIFLLKFEFFEWSCKHNVEYGTIHHNSNISEENPSTSKE
eukprot:185893_1